MGDSSRSSNISGNITVRGIDGADLTILATKRVSDLGSARNADEALRRVEVEIRQRGNRVSVETEYRRVRGDGSRVSVDYEIGVPRSTGVRIESIAGDVSVEGVDGRTRVEVVSGGRAADVAGASRRSRGGRGQHGTAGRRQRGRADGGPRRG